MTFHLSFVFSLPMSVNFFFPILYPLRKFSTPKITSNFIAQTYLEIGREFFLFASTFSRLFPLAHMEIIHPPSENYLPSKQQLSTLEVKIIYHLSKNYLPSTV